jgi:hypothetical protein
MKYLLAFIGDEILVFTMCKEDGSIESSLQIKYS